MGFIAAFKVLGVVDMMKQFKSNKGDDILL